MLKIIQGDQQRVQNEVSDHSRPNKTMIMRMVNSFRKEVFENKTRNRPRSIFTAEKFSEIRSKFKMNGQTSLQKMSAQVGVSRMSVKHAKEMLNLKPYKVHVVQELLPADDFKCV